MISEVARSHPAPRTYLVNPRYQEIGGLPCHPSLADLPGPVDLVLLAVPDTALEEQLALAAGRGDRSAVIFGSAYEPPGQPPGQRPALRARLAAIASAAGMAVCGAGCMGFVNVARGLRAIGYIEPDPLPRGPVALVTHSGSVFSALLRTRRALGFTLAVSSGQELVTGAGQYAGLRVESGRDAGAGTGPGGAARAGPDAGGAGRRRRAGHPGGAADRGEHGPRPGHGGRALRGAGRRGRGVGGAGPGLRRAPGAGPGRDDRHPGAVRGRPPRPPAGRPRRERPGQPPPAADPARPAPEVTLESMFTLASWASRPCTTRGWSARTSPMWPTSSGVPFAAISEETLGRLAGLLDPGLEPGNPLDVWGTGADARVQLAGSLAALAADPAVAAVALAVDLVHRVRRRRLLPARRAGRRRGARRKPVAVLSNVPGAIDPGTAARLRSGRRSRCWRAPAPACSPCATCSTTRPGAQPTVRGTRRTRPARRTRSPRRTRPARGRDPPGQGCPAGGRGPAGPVDGGDHGRRGSRQHAVPAAGRLRHPLRAGPPGRVGG